MADRNIHSTTTEHITMRILSNGIETGGEFAVRSIYTTRGFNMIPTARIILHDGDIPTEDFLASNEDTFAPGHEVQIKLGYGGDEETVFKGIITAHGIRTRDSEQSLLEVVIKHPVIKMTINRANRYFAEMSDSDIIEEICDLNGIEKDVEATDDIHHEMVQYYVTDWDFLVARAEANGMLVIPTDDNIEVKKPQISNPAVLDLVYGQNIVEFEVNMDARRQYGAVVTKAWDYTNQEVIEIEGNHPVLEEPGNISTADLSEVVGLESFDLRHSGRLTNTELQTWADATLFRSTLSKIQGRIRIVGFSDIQPGQSVQLGGLGNRFNGLAFVSGVSHSYGTESLWYTDLQIGFPQELLTERFDNVEPRSASGLLSGIRGLQVGKVSAIQDDPDGEDRIQVFLPILEAENPGIWARVASLDAGENRGAFFRPEIDDEVIVGFVNNDPRDAIILGMLNSSAKPAPITADDSNPVKGFVTRSGMKILFDDESISISLETPNGNHLLISDEDGAIKINDENGNAIVMDSNGIQYESSGDFIIKAAGDVKIEGTNIDIKASASLKASGNASTEISSSATTMLKGSLVQIN